MAKLLAMILAGGRGERLDPLTRDRAKPAVPFGGRYRIIDFVLSNFANSGVLKMKVLTQYKSDSLSIHLNRAWRLSNMLGHYVEMVPAQMRVGPEWFKGSADAVYQNLNIITDEDPDCVFVFGADHIYRMDVRQMLQFHEEKRADCTVAAIPVPIGLSAQFGVIEVDSSGRMVGFVEKPRPEDAKPMPGRPDICLASMGNYLFNSEALVREILRDAARPESAHDFGKSIIGEMYRAREVYVYDFATNRVPGQREKERGYWRDVGTLETYFQTNMDLLQIDPAFSLDNDRWPLFTETHPYPPARFVYFDPAHERIGHATESLVSEGCVISGGHVQRSILSPRVRVNSFAQVEDSILFENVSIGRRCRVRRAIIDKNVEIPPGTHIGYDRAQDERHFKVTESGLVVIPKNMRIEPD